MPEAMTKQSEETLEAVVQTLFQTLNLEIEVETEITPDNIYYNFTGKDQKRLQDYRGETLRAICVLLQAYWDRHYPENQLEIKCDVDQEGRRLENELREKAFAAAVSLQSEGDQVEIGPFNSYERRLIHMALKEQAHVATESVGEGHQKRMRLRYVATETGAQDQAENE